MIDDSTPLHKASLFYNLQEVKITFRLLSENAISKFLEGATEFNPMNLGSSNVLSQSYKTPASSNMEISSEGDFYQSHRCKDYMYGFLKGWLRQPQDRDEIYNLRRRQNQ